MNLFCILLTYCINSSRSKKKSKLFLSRLIGIFVPLSHDVCNDISEQYAKLSKIFTKI